MSSTICDRLAAFCAKPQPTYHGIIFTMQPQSSAEKQELSDFKPYRTNNKGTLNVTLCHIEFCVKSLDKLNNCILNLNRSL